MRRSVCGAVFCAALFAASARADAPPPTAATAAPTPAAAVKGYAFSELPGVSDPEIAARWREGQKLEDEENLLASAAVYEDIVRRVPDQSHTYWRVAKDYWRYGLRLPADDKEGHTKYATLTEEWADRGLAINPNCGECCLYKVAGMGALIQLKGSMLGATQASTIAELLERGITAINAEPHPERNLELEELYFAAAKFYQGVPEWFWLKWVIGVRGSRTRALEYMRKANQQAGQRPAYMVELGAMLLCLGKDQNDAAATAEGTATLRAVTVLQTDDPDDAVDQAHAQILLSEPETACGYSRDEWTSKK